MIPYTIERRPDTGVTNVTLGIWLFLASEVMLFGALFSAYALVRTAAPVWPHGRAVLNVGLGTVNTIVLVTLTALAWRARRTTDGGRTLVVASCLGLLFLVVKSLEYHGEMVRGLVPATNTFLALYFTLTGLHALHVAGGIVANLWAISGLSRVGAAMTTGRIRALGLYWMFVDVVWLIMFALFYLS